VVVYGPAQDDQKTMFLTQLVSMCSRETFPLLIGGDFNILRSLDEKNKDNYNERWPFWDAPSVIVAATVSQLYPWHAPTVKE
jgi:hypothetical protein